MHFFIKQIVYNRICLAGQGCNQLLMIYHFIIFITFIENSLAAFL